MLREIHALCLAFANTVCVQVGKNEYDESVDESVSI